MQKDLNFKDSGLFLYLKKWYNRGMEKTIYTREELNNMSMEELTEMVLRKQDELAKVETTVDFLTEQLTLMRAQKFGRSSEKIDNNQISFFNEIEGIADQEPVEEPFIEEVVKEHTRKKKVKGKRDEDLSGIPVEVIEHTISEDTLIAELGNDYGRFPDTIYRKLRFIPASFVVEEHHIASYYSKTNGKKLKADHPVELMENSIVTPSLAAGIMNAKYINSMPLHRIEKEFERQDIHLGRQVMAGWMIKLTERYFSLVYDRMKEELLKSHVIHADETPVKVKKTDEKKSKKSVSKSYMWVYRSPAELSHKVVLYDYSKTRESCHLEDYLKEYKGVVVCDGYEAYHKLERQRKNEIKVAGCYVHLLRKFKDSIKSAGGADKKKTKFLLAEEAIKQLLDIVKEDNALKELSPEERLKGRNKKVKPLVEGFFAWVELHKDDVPEKSNTGKAFVYALNQEPYLKTFLDYADVPMSNNAAEQSIRNFTIGRKNWQVIDTPSGAESSAMLYGLAETAKVNNLKPYEYFRYLLEEIPKHMNDHNLEFIEELLPWSEKLPDLCRKSK